MRPRAEFRNAATSGFAAPLDDFGHTVELDGLPDAAKVFASRLAVLQVERDGVDAGLRLRFGDDQSPTGAPAHVCDRVMFE